MMHWNAVLTLYRYDPEISAKIDKYACEYGIASTLRFFITQTVCLVSRFSCFPPTRRSVVLLAANQISDSHVLFVAAYNWD